MHTDPGFFGPGSLMWRVNRHSTVLFGGARALLMHAAHPLIAAGARQTGGYRRDPWARLIRTVQLQNLVTFGSEREAREAADRINKLHRAVNGIDSVTGKPYDALDPYLLLWVHAALEVSTIDFYEFTVGPLTSEEKDRYHDENKTSAELVLLARDHIPSSYEDMTRYVEEVIGGGDMILTDVAEEVAGLIASGPVPARIKPLWRLIAFAAVGTLHPRLRRMYGFPWGPFRQHWLDLNFAAIRAIQPALPRRFGLILPARWAAWRLQDAGVAAG